MTNQGGTTLYVGVTSDLLKRVYEHRDDLAEGFTKRYRCHKLVYWEQCGDVTTAIAREKQLKASSRLKKVALIKSLNPEWKDLWEDIM
jgi:putative endonuclease